MSSAVFISPHNDDETLWGSFTLLRERPLVVIVFDSYVQANRGLRVTKEQRRTESTHACDLLNCKAPLFMGYRDDRPEWGAIAKDLEALCARADRVYAPAYEEGGHSQHNTLAVIANSFSAAAVTRYLSYTKAGKSTSGRPVPIEDGSWIALKHRALACYESQLQLDPKMGCWPHFMLGIEEYYA